MKPRNEYFIWMNFANLKGQRKLVFNPVFQFSGTTAPRISPGTSPTSTRKTLWKNSLLPEKARQRWVQRQGRSHSTSIPGFYGSQWLHSLQLKLRKTFYPNESRAIEKKMHLRLLTKRTPFLKKKCDDLCAILWAVRMGPNVTHTSDMDLTPTSKDCLPLQTP